MTPAQMCVAHCKVYVQDRLREHKELVWTLLEEKKAHFYICG